ncbi:MAG TPA: hypothetical protein PLP33_24720 [Leptospiraceae bacterium]|nr:hypothetical protein [Leptospiraceae bacterium]
MACKRQKIKVLTCPKGFGMEKIKKLTSEHARQIKKGDKLKFEKHGGMWEFEVFATLLGVEHQAPYFRAKYQRKWVSWTECYVHDGWIEIP